MCTVCSSPDVDEINRALRAGTPYRALAQRVGVSQRTMGRHGTRCLALPPRAAGRPCLPCLDRRVGEINRALLCNESPADVAARFGHRPTAIANHSIVHLGYDGGAGRKVCAVCVHPDRELVEEAMRSPDFTDESTATEFGLTHGNVLAHRHRHLGITSSTDMRMAQRAARRLAAVERYVAS